MNDSIQATKHYLAVFPDDAAAWFNLACAHAQLAGTPPQSTLQYAPGFHEVPSLISR